MTFSASASSAWKRPRFILSMYSLLSAAGFFAVAVVLLTSPSDSKNSILFGLSLARWMAVLVSAAVGFLFGGFSLKSRRDAAWVNRFWSLFSGQGRESLWLRALSIALFLLSYALIFTPADRFGRFEPYFARAYPIAIWFACFSGLTLALMWLGKYALEKNFVRSALAPRAIAFIVTAVIFLFSLAYWGFGFQLAPSRGDEYIYGAGVPVLGQQVLSAFVLGLLTLQAGRSNLLARVKHLDLWLCAVLWIFTAALWIHEPAPPSYFNPGPYPPNNEYYPFSDAALFDLGAQYALIGQKLFSGMFFERPLYMQFLVFVHMLAGQHYTDVADLQAAIYALFPVLLYLLGKELSGRPLGIGLGALAALRGLNSIAGASIIDLGSPKQLLTDFPTALCMALLVYLTVKWMRNPSGNRLYALWAGGLIGLSSLVRTNFLLLLIPVGVLLLIVHRRKLTLAAALGAGLAAMFVLSILPWGLPSGTFMLNTYYIKLRNVIELRYYSRMPVPQMQDAPVSFVSASASVSSVVVQPDLQSLPSLGFVPLHFFHNILTSFLSLPASPFFHDLRSTVKEFFPYWQQSWDGSVSAGAGFLALQLVVLAFGLGMAWKRLGLAGLTPFLLFLTYQLSNALGRTSGGRYIVPADWIVLVYYLFGLFEAVYLFLELFGQKQAVNEGVAWPADNFKWNKQFTARMFGVAVIFVAIGLSPTLTDNIFPLRYSPTRASSALDQLDTSGNLQKGGMPLAAVNAFLKQPEAVMIYGRGLYPRFYAANKGELDSGYPYGTLPFPRLAFTLISPRTADNVLLPVSELSYFPNASDVLILGCAVPSRDPHRAHIDALAVFVIEPDRTTAYTRQPSAPLQCPAPPVICDNNKECRSGD